MKKTFLLSAFAFIFFAFPQTQNANAANKPTATQETAQSAPLEMRRGGRGRHRGWGNNRGRHNGWGRGRGNQWR